jgi:hypothetical protein
MAPISNGVGVPAGGQIYLVDGPVVQAGQGNITVTPFGSNGTGAVGNANLGISGTVVISNVGTGSTSASYKPGEVLSLSGGTPTGNKIANVTVEAVQVRIVSVNAGGAAYSIGDSFTFEGPGYAQTVDIVVNAISSNVVTNVSIVTSGEYTLSTLPTNPVTPNTQTVANGAASGATFNLGWGLNEVAVANEGDYIAIPANPVAVIGSADGTGAKVTVTYSVSSLFVVSAGSNYNTSPTVDFSTGNAQAVSIINGAGSVTGFTVTYGGTSYAVIPNVFIVDSSATFNLAKLTNNLAYTFTGNTYEWVLTGIPLAGPTFATIQSQ